MAATDLIAIIAVFGGSVGFAFGLYQYYIAQKWKKSEFAARLIEQLSKDPQLSTCCKLLDWSTRSFPVPQQYRALTEESTFFHNWETLVAAMMPEQDRGPFEFQEMLYRDLFDHFFHYLERINHYITIRLITINDVVSLEYWLRQLAFPRFVEVPVFIDFLQTYEYSGVFELMHKFKIDIKDDST